MTSTNTAVDPLELILPVAQDRLAWRCVGQVTASDTHEAVFEYEHAGMGRALRLDARGRVYGMDPEGVVRLFGRGGPLALAIALNAIYDGRHDWRPARVVLPEPADDDR